MDVRKAFFTQAKVPPKQTPVLYLQLFITNVKVLNPKLSPILNLLIKEVTEVNPVIYLVITLYV